MAYRTAAAAAADHIAATGTAAVGRRIAADDGAVVAVAVRSFVAVGCKPPTADACGTRHYFGYLHYRR